MIRKPLQIDPETSDKGISAVFEERLSVIIEALGGPSKVAERFGVGRESVWKWRKGKARPSLFNVAEMCAEAGYSIDWLMGLMPSVQSGFTEPYVFYSHGGSDQGSKAKDTIRFQLNRDWLQALGVAPDKVAVMDTVGGSMAPTIPDGSTMLIDTTSTEPRDGCIHVLTRNGAAVVRRFRLTSDGSFLLICDNSQYPEEHITRHDVEKMEIVGRVIWVGHRV